MIHVRMLHPVNGESAALDRAADLVITGETMTVGGVEVATHDNGQWHYQGEHYTTILLDSPVRVRFEDDGGRSSLVHGPFDRLKVVDGSIRTGDRYSDVLARLDERSKHWEVYGEPGEWLRAVFAPA
jgi:hypothetical protein